MDQGSEKTGNPLRVPTTVLKDHDSRLSLVVDKDQTMIARILLSPIKENCSTFSYSSHKL